jgi:hypothetical protein
MRHSKERNYESRSHTEEPMRHSKERNYESRSHTEEPMRHSKERNYESRSRTEEVRRHNVRSKSPLCCKPHKTVADPLKSNLSSGSQNSGLQMLISFLPYLGMDRAPWNRTLPLASGTFYPSRWVLLGFVRGVYGCCCNSPKKIRVNIIIPQSDRASETAALLQGGAHPQVETSTPDS